MTAFQFPKQRFMSHHNNVYSYMINVNREGLISPQIITVHFKLPQIFNVTIQCQPNTQKLHTKDPRL